MLDVVGAVHAGEPWATRLGSSLRAFDGIVDDVVSRTRPRTGDAAHAHDAAVGIASTVGELVEAHGDRFAPVLRDRLVRLADTLTPRVDDLLSQRRERGVTGGGGSPEMRMPELARTRSAIIDARSAAAAVDAADAAGVPASTSLAAVPQARTAAGLALLEDADHDLARADALATVAVRASRGLRMSYRESIQAQHATWVAKGQLTELADRVAAVSTAPQVADVVDGVRSIAARTVDPMYGFLKGREFAEWQRDLSTVVTHARQSLAELASSARSGAVQLGAPAGSLQRVTPAALADAFAIAAAAPAARTAARVDLAQPGEVAAEHALLQRSATELGPLLDALDDRDWLVRSPWGMDARPYPEVLADIDARDVLRDAVRARVSTIARSPLAPTLPTEAVDALLAVDARLRPLETTEYRYRVHLPWGDTLGLPRAATALPPLESAIGATPDVLRSSIAASPLAASDDPWATVLTRLDGLVAEHTARVSDIMPPPDGALATTSGSHAVLHDLAMLRLQLAPARNALEVARIAAQPDVDGPAVAATRRLGDLIDAVVREHPMLSGRSSDHVLELVRAASAGSTDAVHPLLTALTKVEAQAQRSARALEAAGSTAGAPAPGTLVRMVAPTADDVTASLAALADGRRQLDAGMHVVARDFHDAAAGSTTALAALDQLRTGVLRAGNSLPTTLRTGLLERIDLLSVEFNDTVAAWRPGGTRSEVDFPWFARVGRLRADLDLATTYVRGFTPAADAI